MNNSWRRADGHDGLLLRRVLVPDLTSSNVVREAVRRRQLTPVQRGVYLPGPRQASALEAARAALAAVGQPDSAASHATAAVLHGLRVPDGRYDREHNHDSSAGASTTP